MEVYKFDRTLELFKRAGKVIPGGIYGQRHPAFMVPGSFPYFAERGEGSKFWDVDGQEYIDYMCGFGPIVLGYNHPKIEEVVTKIREKGDCFNLSTEKMVELAEYLCNLVPVADWAVFAKNGSDVTTYAVQVAREYTGRKKIITCQNAYHGSHPWCSPGYGGIIEEDKINILIFKWNDIDGFLKLIEQHKGEVAGVILTPYHHPAYGDQEMPKEGFWKTIQNVCNKEDIVLVSDDIRAGFRLDMRGSNEYFGYKPDLVTFCKTLANGHPISCCCGQEKLKKIASHIFFTGTFYFSRTPMAAAIATLDELQRIDGINYMNKIGKMLQDGLQKLADAHNVEVVITGPPAIPFMRFKNDDGFIINQMFCGECCKRGIFFHPHHNWFISCAHTEEDIKKTLEVADIAFKIVKEKTG